MAKSEKTSNPAVLVMDSVTIRLPEVVKLAYDDEAETSGQSVEDTMADRLASCIEHRAVRPLYFDDDDRRQLELLAGRQFGSAGDFNKYFKKAFVLKINQVEYTMDPLVRDRMLDRCFGRPLSVVLKEALDEFFSNYVML